LKEILYAAERNFLERYLKEKSSATIADMKAVTDLWDNPIALPGTAEAVDKIYSLEDGAARIRIEGPLSNEGPDPWDLFWGYGGTSYQDIIAALGRAKNDPLVKSVILDIDSPGGIVDGVDQTWQAIRSVGKPVTALAGSLVASAAYWLASAADKIYADAPTSETGSIGVLVATYDWSKWEEKIGIKEIVITSSNAPDKAPDPATEHGRDTILARLDALERIFYARVSEGRGVTADHIAGHFGKGGLLVASDPSPDHEDAIRAGMIDGLLAVGRFNTDHERPLSAQEKKEIITRLNRFEESQMSEAIERLQALEAIGDTMKPGAKSYSADGKELPPAECEKIRNAFLSPSSEGTNTPAQAGNREDKAVTLSEFLAQNPAAQPELDRVKAEARTAGRDEANAEFHTRVGRMIGVINSKSYPEAIKALAGDVLSGAKGIDAFDAAVAVYDTQKEAAASAAAREETAATGALGADSPASGATAEKELDAAIKAELDKRRAEAHA
jgi:ClpP class serine protease